MRVLIQKRSHGKSDMLVVPRKGLPVRPVWLRGMTRGDRQELLVPVLERMAEDEAGPRPSPSRETG